MNDRTKEQSCQDTLKESKPCGTSLEIKKLAKNEVVTDTAACKNSKRKTNPYGKWRKM